MSPDVEQIGPYRIEGRLGKGAMAVVYRAVQPSVNRVVALKVLPPDLENDEIAIRRFAQEAETAANLEHPNIVKVWDASINHPPYYIALQFLDGGTLEDRLGKGPFPLRQAVQIIKHVCRALDYAHSKGIVHRDIKPANIMFDHKGVPILTDFGIARVADRTRITADGSTFGTPDYMSPEQAKGRLLDIRSDLYSTAVVFYEMLTGRPPFTGDEPLTVLNQIVNDPVPPMSKFGASVPSAVERVVIRALSKDPEKRYQSGLEFTKALEYALQGKRPNVKRKSSLRMVLTAILILIIVTSGLIIHQSTSSFNGGGGGGGSGTVVSQPLRRVVVEPAIIPTEGLSTGVTFNNAGLRLAGDVKIIVEDSSGNLLASASTGISEGTTRAEVFIPANSNSDMRKLRVVVKDPEGKEAASTHIQQMGNPRMDEAISLNNRSVEVLEEVNAEMEQYLKQHPSTSEPASVLRKWDRKCEKAVQLADQAIKIAPGLEAAYYNRIAGLLTLEQEERAREYAVDALRRFPNSRDLKKALKDIKVINEE